MTSDTRKVMLDTLGWFILVAGVAALAFVAYSLIRAFIAVVLLGS